MPAQDGLKGPLFAASRAKMADLFYKPCNISNLDGAQNFSCLSCTWN